MGNSPKVYSALLLLSGLVSSNAIAAEGVNVGQWRAINTSEILTRTPYSIYWRDQKIGREPNDDDLYNGFSNCCSSPKGQLKFLRANRRDQRTVRLSENETYALYHEQSNLYLTSLGWVKQPRFDWKVQILGTPRYRVPTKNPDDEFYVPSVAFRLYNVGARQYVWISPYQTPSLAGTCAGPMLPSAQVSALVLHEDDGGRGVGGCVEAK
jgi:hypothetical protein